MSINQSKCEEAIEEDELDMSISFDFSSFNLKDSIEEVFNIVKQLKIGFQEKEQLLALQKHIEVQIKQNP